MWGMPIIVQRYSVALTGKYCSQSPSCALVLGSQMLGENNEYSHGLLLFVTRPSRLISIVIYQLPCLAEIFQKPEFYNFMPKIWDRAMFCLGRLGFILGKRCQEPIAKRKPGGAQLNFQLNRYIKLPSQMWHGKGEKLWMHLSSQNREIQAHFRDGKSSLLDTSQDHDPKSSFAASVDE